MHRSRVYAVLIDTPAEDADRAAAFWGAVLGVTPRANAEEPQFVELPDAVRGVVAAVQSVDDAPRIHLDIETDDVEAETARLVGLGAVEHARWRECRVLRAPGGHLLCVLPVETDPSEFAAAANVWP